MVNKIDWDNPKEVNKYHREYRERNRKELRGKGREYYQEHKKEIKEHLQIPEVKLKRKKYEKKWRQENEEK